MKRNTRYLLLVGAALCVTPIFSSVQAQQSSNEAKMLLQMQQMQAEIAELRDMVERQQYQLQRMQRNIQTAERGRVGVPAQNSGLATMGDSSASQEAVGSSENDTLAGDERWLFNGSAQSDQNTEQPATEAVAQPSVSGEGFYQAEPRPIGVPDVANDAGTTIEERVITAPPLSQTTGGQNYPPVEDRSIGAAGLPAADADNQLRLPANRNPVVSQIPEGTIDAGQRPTEPMIAIPDSPSAQLPASVPSNAATGQPVNPDALPEQEYYQQGFNLVKQSKFKDAIRMFQQLIANYPNGSLRADAVYWIGEAGFLDRDLATSKRYFRTFMDSYPQNARMPGAMLRTAYIEQEQGNLIEARILLNEIIQYHPSSDAVHAAKNRLADLESKVN